MTSESPPEPAAENDTHSSSETSLPAATKQSRSLQKGAATVRLNREARRLDRLDLIRTQIANGTLIVRQTTTAQHEASQLARDAGARNTARRRQGAR